jgi:hypothetical protein
MLFVRRNGAKREELMVEWQAYYFDSFDNRSPPIRIIKIQADNEDEAGRIAIAQMGRSMRVQVTRPVWGDKSIDLGSHASNQPAGRCD